MKRAFLAVFCGVALIANSAICAADSIPDKEMADRYSQAAQSGDNDAQFYLGALYSSGVGRPRSDEQALQWFSRRAEQGHSHAMLVLAGLYAIGRGTAKDNVSAYKWAYIVSVGSRMDEFRNGARQLMGVLETKMTPQELNQARADAARWHAVPTPATARPSPGNPPRATTPPPHPLAPASKQAPTASAAPATSAPSATSADSGNSQAARSGKKDDIDTLIDKVPELRKRLGF